MSLKRWIFGFFLLALLSFLPCTAFSQASSGLSLQHAVVAMPALDLVRLHWPATDLLEADAPENSTKSIQPEEGLVRRSVRRTLQDQKSLYLAPFKPSNFKWDLLVLGSFGALLATDRRIERHLPGGNVNLYSNISNVAIGTLSGALTATWIYGFKTNNSKAKDMGYLELETLVNTFLIYTLMQLIGARQRPGVRG